MTYDVTSPETAQEHKVPLIPKHNNIYKKIFNALPVIHNYQAWKDVLKLNTEFPKYFPNFFLYNNDSDIHLLQTHKNPLLQVYHTKDTTHSETAFFCAHI